MNKRSVSFSVGVKEELCAAEVKRQCCRRAEIAGMLFAAGSASPDGTVNLTVPLIAAPLAARLIQEQFTRAPTVKHGAVSATIGFVSAAAARMAARRDIDLSLIKCADCAATMLRGMFIAAGSVNSPDSENYLQLCIADFEGCLAVKDAALATGIVFSAGRRRNANYLYIKSRQSIEDALATLGAKAAYFEFINAGIEKLARGDANRAANCITSNIKKTVSAASRQIQLIREMKDAGALSSLPPELEEAARLRLENPTLPVERLGMLMSPPVTKSGMYHRLTKLMQAAQDFFEKQAGGGQASSGSQNAQGKK